MNPYWIIEHTFDDDVSRLCKTLDKLKVEYKVVSNPVYEGKWKDLYSAYDCVVTYGSIAFGNLVKREGKWIPGHLCDNETFKCSTYYQHFNKKDLLNGNTYFMLPFHALETNKDFIYDMVGQQDAVFIRPDSGNKTFTGKIVYRERFERELDQFKCYDPKPESLCIIAPPKMVKKEWRFFVVDRKVICGSEYKPGRHNVLMDKEAKTEDGLDDYLALRKAKEVLESLDWEPQRVWCLDICKTAAGNFYVLEIGSFSSAGLYACELEELVKKINHVAIIEWICYYG